MKSIRLTLRETEDGSYRVESYSNTVQVRCGMIVDAKRVAQWCNTDGVLVNVVGMVESESETADLDSRPDALELANS